MEARTNDVLRNFVLNLHNEILCLHYAKIARAWSENLRANAHDLLTFLTSRHREACTGFRKNCPQT